MSTNPVENKPLPKFNVKGFEGLGADTPADLARDFLEQYNEYLKGKIADPATSAVNKTKYENTKNTLNESWKKPEDFVEGFVKAQVPAFLKGNAATKDKAGFFSAVNSGNVVNDADLEEALKDPKIKEARDKFLKSLNEKDHGKLFDDSKAAFDKSPSGWLNNLKDQHKGDFIGILLEFVEKTFPQMFGGNKAPAKPAEQKLDNNGNPIPEKEKPNTDLQYEASYNVKNNRPHQNGPVAGLFGGIANLASSVSYDVGSIIRHAPGAVLNIGKNFIEGLTGVDFSGTKAKAKFEKEEREDFSKMTTAEKTVYKQVQDMAQDVNGQGGATVTKHERKGLDKLSDLFSKQGESVTDNAVKYLLAKTDEERNKITLNDKEKEFVSSFNNIKTDLKKTIDDNKAIQAANPANTNIGAVKELFTR